MVGAVGGEQSRFGADEGNGVAGPDRCAEQRTGVGIETARTVECKQRAAVACGQYVGAADEAGVRFADLALESDAEQAVNDQRPAQPVGYRRECAAARIDKAPEGICRVNRQVLGRPDKNHLRVEEAFAQQYCDFKGVAAVVSGAGENQDTCATLGADRRGQVSRRTTGALHQGLIGGCGFDVAQVGRAVERNGGHGRTMW